jgi:hypothetical protein
VKRKETVCAGEGGIGLLGLLDYIEGSAGRKPNAAEQQQQHITFNHPS